MNFEHQCVLVTGAAANSGYVIARRFAAAGATVWLNDVEPEATRAAAASIVAATATRRNIFVSGADLNELVEREFEI